MMKESWRASRHAKAFTLIELLVVIAVIAILAAILFPVFARARQKAWQVKCMSNGKQLGIATMLYVDDWDAMMRMLSTGERRVPINTWRGSTYYPTRWAVRYFVMEGYVRNDEIWVCPTAYRWMESFAFGLRMTWKPRLDGPGGDAYGDRPLAERTLTDIGMIDGELSKRICWWCLAFGEESGGAYYPHMKGTNYIYLDGHAAWSVVGNYWAPPGYPAPGLDPPYN